jgi:hypothetical protein
MKFAKGCLIGLTISLACWGLIFLAIYGLVHLFGG